MVTLAASVVFWFLGVVPTQAQVSSVGPAGAEVVVLIARLDSMTRQADFYRREYDAAVATAAVLANATANRLADQAALISPRLVNLSSRGPVSPGSPLIVGFVISGTAGKTVLLRAAGPALTQFGVVGALSAPRLDLYRGGVLLATNAGWTAGVNALTGAVSAAAGQAGAFPFAIGSADSALLVQLSPGAYTIQVSGGTGAALAEVYEVSP